MTAPTLTGLTAPVFDENTVNATPQIIDADVTLTDVEGDFDGGTVTVSGLLAQDTVSIASGAIVSLAAGVVYHDADGAGGAAAVAIGTAAGGAGADFVITFNASATTAMVDAVIEALTYANSSDAPTTGRDLSIVVVDAAGSSSAVAAFALLGPGANPFTSAAIDVGAQSRPAFVDLDGDGDLDLIVGAHDGTIYTWLNTAGVFSELIGGSNPFDGINVGAYAAPTFVDIDGDLDLDMVVGDNAGLLHAYENDGGAFAELIGGANPFNTYDTHLTSPTFTDIDGDGDLDAVVGNYDGSVSVLENDANVFTLLAGGANPLSAIDVGFGAAPAFIDIDGDGDLDLLVGSANYATISTFRNDGGVFTELTGASNPFNGIAVGNNPSPALFDVDADGDPDIVMGGINGELAIYTQVPAATSSITVTVTAQNDAPEAAGLPSDVTVVEETASDLDLSAITLTDIDTAGDITVTLTASAGTMTASSGGGVTVTNSGTGAITLTGTASAIDTFLNTASAIQYTGAANASGDDAATVTITADDGSGAVELGVVNIDITGTDDPMTLTGVTATATFNENLVNDTPQLLDADVTFAHGDNDYDGGTLTVGGLLAEDTVSVNNEGTGAGEIGLSGADVTYAGVIIGTLAGGAGATLTITFNASATSEAIDALIQNLTYANASDAPTASRTVAINVTDAAGEQFGGLDDFTLAGTNPLAGIDVGGNASPEFADLDADGDLDLVGGSEQGFLTYYRNDGTATASVFVQVTGVGNPVPAAFLGAYHGAPRLIDIDNDGDLDLFVGRDSGNYRYWENTGTAAAAVFTERTGGDNPLNGILHNSYASPAFVDLDDDGDLDLVALSSGRLDYYENTGTVSAPVYTLAGVNPLSAFGAGGTHGGTIDFFDVDGDGDLDAAIGALSTDPRYLENTGTVSSPVFVERTGADNRVAVVSAGGLIVSSPQFVDINGDGVMDLVTGEHDGTLRLFYAAQVGLPITVTVTAEDDGPTAGPDSFTGTAGADVLEGLGGDDVLDGGDGADTLKGGEGEDDLTGGDGADTLNGGAGADAMAGGTGDDYYFVDDAGDVVDETGGDGTDTVGSFIDHVLGDGVENLTLLARFGTAFNGTGNGLDNVMTGNGEDNILAGLDGADTLRGGQGDDHLIGGDGDDVLDGGTGADRLNGGAGADAMTGGAGGDVYVVDDAGDTVIELAGGGTDAVEASISHTLADHVENLTLQSRGGAINGTGNGLNNVINGNSAANTLSGLGGNDMLYGWGGHDTLNGGDGTDTLEGGVGNDTLNGGDGRDTLYGGDGHDRLDGGVGADYLYGGDGNDTYVTDHPSDHIFELAGGGIDTIESDHGYGMEDFVENMTLTGTVSTDAYGNALNNILIGNSGDNLLRGLAGNDTVTGGGGGDTFLFASEDIGVGLFVDRILDLDFAQGDIVDLSAIDADSTTMGDQAFSLVARFTGAAGEMTLSYAGAKNLTTLNFDIDGDGVTDYRIILTGDHRGTTTNLYTGGGDVDGGWVL